MESPFGEADHEEDLQKYLKNGEEVINELRENIPKLRQAGKEENAQRAEENLKLLLLKKRQILGRISELQKMPDEDKKISLLKGKIKINEGNLLQTENSIKGTANTPANQKIIEALLRNKEQFEGRLKELKQELSILEQQVS